MISLYLSFSLFLGQGGGRAASVGGVYGDARQGPARAALPAVQTGPFLFSLSPLLSLFRSLLASGRR